MKKIILICFVALFSSCEVEYDGEKRLVVDTKLVDRNGDPIPGKKITILNSYDVISSGFTDANGNLFLAFPSPLNETLDINIEGGNENYQFKSYMNVPISDFEDYKFNLNPLILLKNDDITILNISLNQTGNNTILQNIYIDAIEPNEFTDFTENVNPVSYLQTEFRLAKNQNFVLKYTIIDYQSTPIETEYSVNLSVANDAITYTINY